MIGDDDGVMRRATLPGLDEGGIVPDAVFGLPRRDGGGAFARGIDPSFVAVRTLVGVLPTGVKIVISDDRPTLGKSFVRLDP